jgi:hypothetical protein
MTLFTAFQTSIILKPAVSTAGKLETDTHIYHLFKNITSDVMFLKR